MQWESYGNTGISHWAAKLILFCLLFASTDGTADSTEPQCLSEVTPQTLTRSI